MTALSQYILQWQGYFQNLGLLGVALYALLIMVLQMCCAPLSPIAVAAGLIFGIGRGFAAVQIGTVLGAALNFTMSRYLFRERVRKWLGHHEKFRLIDDAIGREGWKIVALLRFCPIPFGIANYSFGLTAVPFVPYLVATSIVIVVGNFFFVWFGATSSQALTALSGAGGAPPGQLIFTAVGLVAFFVALTYVARIARAAVMKKDVQGGLPAAVATPAPSELN